jgi:ketosteroid isomerase-like protein
VIQTTEARAALKSFDAAQETYLSAFAKVPAKAMSYLKAGDDYSIGGIAVHVVFVLEHYTNVLDTIAAADFAECRPQDPTGLEARALAKAKSPLSPEEVNTELAQTKRLHVALAKRIDSLSEAWSRKAPTWYGDAAEPFPTGPADVLQWVTDHYLEHVPHMKQLVEDWGKHAGDQTDPVAVVAKFNEAFARGDVDAVMALMTEDCIFENTFPAPDGERHVGAKAVRQFWNQFFASTDAPRFETEELIAVDDRVVTRWRFSWGSGTAGGHVRGADVFRVRDGKVAEKLSYVKG